MPGNLFYALDASTGQVAWKYPTGITGGNSSRYGTAVIANDMVYFGASQLGAPTSQAGGYFALHISTHQLAWKQQLDVDPALPIMLVGNTLYLDTSSNLGAYDAQTGKQQWAMNTSFSPVTLANNLIYGIDYSQHLFAVSLDGKPQWQIDPMFGTSMISSLSAQMLYAQGVIYLARYDSTSKHWQIYAISVS